MCGLSHSKKILMGGMSHIFTDRDMRVVFIAG